MFSLSPLKLYFPIKPKNQVFDSFNMKSKDNNISFSKENYANIISENTSLIRKNWEKTINLIYN